MPPLALLIAIPLAILCTRALAVSLLGPAPGRLGGSALRASVIMGFVGAGGLGQMLYYHLSIFQQAQAATVLIAMFVLVLAVDALSDRLRMRMARS